MYSLFMIFQNLATTAANGLKDPLHLPGFLISLATLIGAWSCYQLALQLAVYLSNGAFVVTLYLGVPMLTMTSTVTTLGLGLASLSTLPYLGLLLGSIIASMIAAAFIDPIARKNLFDFLSEKATHVGNCISETANRVGNLISETANRVGNLISETANAIWNWFMPKNGTPGLA